MERLEPVLKQKFWILLGLGIVMTIVGWWMATGSLAATIATRRTEIENAEKKVPGGEIPNNDWSTKLAAVNVEQERAVKSTSRALWERQRARMTWPESIEEFAWKNGYRGEIPIDGREVYRTDYYYSVNRVWETVRPFKSLDGSGIVEFPLTKLPKQQWGHLAPSSAEMWDAQEDLWLLEAILQSIAEVNGENSTRLDACIHLIERLTLHGGQPAGQRTVASASGANSNSSFAGGAASSESMSASAGASFGGYGTSGGTGGGQTTAISADFDVKEELGDDGGGTASSGGASSSAFGQSSAAFGGGTGAGDQTNAGPKARRYVDDEDALPFKTRGFYMTVIMDHRKIPNLIAELSGNEKSAWPIEIIRVQVVRLHEDDIDGRSTSGGTSFLSSSGQPGTSSGAFGSSGAESFSANSSEGDFPSGFPLSISGVGTTTAATEQQIRAGLAGLQNALQDPYMSRVALCGIITLYKEVKPDITAAPPAATPPAGADSTATPAEPPTAGTPAVPTEPEPATETNPTEAPARESTPPTNGDSATKPDAAPKDDKAPAAPTDNGSSTGNN